MTACPLKLLRITIQPANISFHTGFSQTVTVHMLQGLIITTLQSVQPSLFHSNAPYQMCSVCAICVFLFP